MSLLRQAKEKRPIPTQSAPTNHPDAFLNMKENLIIAHIGGKAVVTVFLKIEEKDDLAIEKLSGEILPALNDFLTKKESLMLKRKTKNFIISKMEFSTEANNLSELYDAGENLNIIYEILKASGILAYAYKEKNIITETFRDNQGKARYRDFKKEESPREYLSRCDQAFEEDKKFFFSSIYKFYKDDFDTIIEKNILNGIEVKEYEKFCEEKKEKAQVKEDRRSIYYPYTMRIGFSEEEEKLISGAVEKSGQTRKNIFLNACRKISNTKSIKLNNEEKDSSTSFKKEIQKAEATITLNNMLTRLENISDRINYIAVKLNRGEKITPDFSDIEVELIDLIEELESNSCYPIHITEEDNFFSYAKTKIFNILTTTPKNLSQIGGKGFEDNIKLTNNHFKTINQFFEEKMFS